MTRQATDQLYIEIGYHTPEEYYVYTAEAQSQQAVSSTLSCDAGKITQAQATVTVTTAVTVTISHIEGADLFAFSESQIQVVVDRIRENNIATSGVFDVSALVASIRSFESAEISDFDLSAVIGRSREFNIETQAAFSIVADGDKFSLQDTEANLVSQTTIIATADPIFRIINQTLESITDISVIAEATKPFASTMAVETVQFATAEVTKATSVNTDVIVSLTADVSRIQSGSASLVNESALSCTISHIEGADLSAFSQSSITALANIIASAGSTSAVTSNVAIALSATRRNSSSIQLTSNIVLGKWAGTTRPNDIDITSIVDVINSFGGSGEPTSPKYGSAMAAIGNTSGGGSFASEVTNNVVIGAGENFLLEMWVWPMGGGAFNNQPGIAGVGITTSTLNNPSTTQFSWGIGTTFAGQLQYKYNNNGTIVSVVSSTSLGGGTSWVHLAFYRYNGNTLALARNGVEVATSSFSGAFRVPNTSTNRRFWVANGSNGRLFVDDIHLRIAPSSYGNFNITNLNSPAQNDPNSTILYYPFDNVLGWIPPGSNAPIPNSDYLGVNEVGAANLLQTSTLTGRITGPQRTAVSILATSTATIQAQKAAEIILSAFGTSQVTANLLKTRLLSSSLESDFDTSIAINRVVVSSAALESQTAQTTDAVKIASAEVTMSGITISLTANARIRSGDIQANVESVLAADVSITAQGSANLVSESAITIPGERIRYQDAGLVSQTESQVDFGIIRQLESAQASNIDQTSVVNITASASVAIQGITISLTALGAIRTGLINMVVESTQTTTAVKTADVIATIDSQTALTASGIIKVDFEADLISTSALQSSGERIRYFDSEQQSQTSVVSDANYIADGQTSLSSITNLSATSRGIVSVIAELASTFEQTTIPSRFRDQALDLFAQTVLSASTNNSLTRTTDSQQSASTELTSTIGRIRPFDASLVADTIDLFVVAKIGSGFVNADVQSVLTASARIIARTSAAVISTTQSQVTATRTARLVSAQASEFDIVAEGTTNITGEGLLTVETTLTAAVNVIRSAVMSNNTESTLSATARVLRGLAFLEQSSGTLTCDLGRIRQFTSNFSAVSIDLIIGNRVVSFSANLVSQTTLSAQGRDIDLAKYVYIVPNEVRTWTIAQENRTRVVKEETRIYKIRRF